MRLSKIMLNTGDNEFVKFVILRNTILKKIFKETLMSDIIVLNLYVTLLKVSLLILENYGHLLHTT